jgi:hypothetical protein
MKADKLRERYPTLKHLSADFNPSHSAVYSRYPSRCVNGNAPVLADINNAYGENASVQWLIAHIAAFQESINVPNKMLPAQYAGLAETIAQEFHFLKTTDIILFLNHLAAGRYNVDFHGYVEPDIILEALRSQYLHYRYRLINQEEERREKEKQKSQPVEKTMTYAEWKKLQKQKQETKNSQP